jgi:hypothetical protein
MKILKKNSTIFSGYFIIYNNFDGFQNRTNSKPEKLSKITEEYFSCLFMKFSNYINIYTVLKKN